MNTENIMKKLLTTATILICFIANAQCLKGDCDDGKGTFKYERGTPQGVYVGEFKDNYPVGKGKFTYEFGKNKYVFDGYFIASKKRNFTIDSTKIGNFLYPNGGELKGYVTEIVKTNMISWELNGEGEKKQELVGGDFRTYKGNFVNNILEDKNGIIISPNGNIYKGGVVNNKRQGIGKIITPEGGIQQDGNWYGDEWIDANKNNPYAVPIYYNGNSIMVDVDFNGTPVRMTLDTGASMTLLNEVKFYSLLALGQIKIKNEQDGKFTIANGDVVYGKIYVIDKMKIGNYEIENVEFSVLDENSSDLLGLNALLETSKSFSIDIEAGELTF